MSAQDTDDRNSVGFLLLRHANQPDTEHRHSIEHNAHFDLGRNQLKNLFGVEDATISKHHLRFQCVVYDHDEPSKVAPMVYMRVLSFNPILFKYSNSAFDGKAITLAKEDGDILLNQDDLLQLTPAISIVFHMNQNSNAGSSVPKAVQVAEMAHFSSRYRLTKRVLGHGGYAGVFVAVKVDSGRQMACKVARQPRHNTHNGFKFEGDRSLEKKRHMAAREYKILKDLDHPNIISVERVVCTPNHIYFFQELTTGGDLYSYMHRYGPLSEPETALIALQLMKAIDHLHDKNIVHRDIKPDNILMASNAAGFRVVLSDFGQSRRLEYTAGRMFTITGTEGFIPPEVAREARAGRIQSGYSMSVDIWTLGVVTAELLTAQNFAPDHSKGEDLRMLRSREVIPEWLKHIPDLTIIDEGETWRHISPVAKAFVKNCMALDENKRPTIKQALSHQWLTDKHYAAELEAAYKRAIADWKPAARQGNIIEHIDPFNASITLSEKANKSPNITTTNASHTTPKTVNQTSYEKLQDLHASPIQPRTSPPNPSIQVNRKAIDPRSQYFVPPPSSQKDLISSHSFAPEKDSTQEVINWPKQVDPLMSWRDAVVARKRLQSEDADNGAGAAPQARKEYVYRQLGLGIRDSAAAFGREKEMDGKRRRVMG